MDARAKRAATSVLERRMLRVVDAALAALYTITFGLALYAVLGDVNTAAVLAVIEALLFAVGWRNTPITLGEGRCILYRSGFVPLYTAIFTLAAWVYHMHVPQPASIAAAAAVLALTYAAYRTGGERAIRLTLPIAIADGVLAYLLAPERATLALAFGAPQVAIAAAKPRILCDDRPVIVVAGLYASVAFLILYFALTPHAP